MRLSSVLNSKQLCIICYWIVSAYNADGDIKRFAKKPGDKSTGNYQKRVDKVMGFRDTTSEEQIVMEVFGFELHSAQRATMEVAVRPAHEAIDKEVGENPWMLARLREAVANRELPESYYHHPVVVESGEEGVVPCAV